MNKCDYCGRENPDESINCSGCGTELISASPIIKSTKAGFWIRALARIIDFLFAFLIGLIGGVMAGLLLAILSAAGFISHGWQYRIHGFSLALFGFSMLGDIFYHLMCEGIHGATLGKLCCGIRVVSEDGKPSKMKGALIRTLAYYIDSLFFGAVGYSSMAKSTLNQRYGDVWGKTAVLKTSEIASESQRTPMHFVLGLFLGVGCWIVMLVTGLVLKAW